MKNKFLLALLLFNFIYLHSAKSQEIDSVRINRDRLDSLFIEETENYKFGPTKVLHAEPLYIDLIRDLGARKGEKEWNIGLGIFDKRQHDEIIALVEYEWAPLDRLGLEIELPFSFFNPRESDLPTPENKLQSLKLAGQYSFYVSEKHKTSMALGYIHEFEITSFKRFRNNQIYTGNLYNPFFVAAKRWGQNFHTLIYAGPQFLQHFENKKWESNWQINSNFHYMVDGTRNFVGIEVNKDVYQETFNMTLRPQVRVGLTEHLLIGIVAGIQVIGKDERTSSFIRIIYEPKHRKKH